MGRLRLPRVSRDQGHHRLHAAPGRRIDERPYTPSEIDALKPFFGASINYDAVRIVCGSGGNPLAWIAHRKGHPAICLGNRIYVREGDYRDDYARASAKLMAAFIGHESTHIWQHQNGGINWLVYLWQWARMRRHGYCIRDVDDHSDFLRLGYEQQAEVVGAYMLAHLNGRPAPKLCWLPDRI